MGNLLEKTKIFKNAKDITSGLSKSDPKKALVFDDKEPSRSSFNYPASVAKLIAQAKKKGDEK